MLVQSGIDAIEVSGNIHGKAQKMAGQEFGGHKILKGGYFYEYAREIADAVSVPVYVKGGFSASGLMEKYMDESAIAGFGMSRAFLCEPNLVSRWMAICQPQSACIVHDTVLRKVITAWYLTGINIKKT